MIRIVLAIFMLAASMLGQQMTPNIGLYIPGHNSQQWDIPLNQNFALLDLLLSGNSSIPALAASGYVAPGAVHISALPSTAPINAHLAVDDGLTPYDCSTGSGSAALHECYCAAVSGGSCVSWLPVVPAPSDSSGGVVKKKNCGTSAIQAINGDTSVTCAASATGGNGVIYQAPATGAFVGDSTFKTVYSYVLPGGTLSATGGIKATCFFGVITGTAYPTSAIGFNLTVVPAGGFASTSYSPEKLTIQWFNNSATNSQWYAEELFETSWSGGGALTTAIDTTADVTVSCLVKKTDGTFSGLGFIVERIAQ